MTAPVRALVFDAYGTLFDPFAVKTRAEELFPGNGAALSHLWRAKQLEYSWLRTLMGRYENFWKITEDALVFSCRTLKLPCDEHQRKQLMQVYLTLPAFPEVKSALEKLFHLPLSILSNGTPEMLAPLVAANTMAHLFMNIFSVDALKMYKPRPEVYQHAVTSLGFPKGKRSASSHPTIGILRELLRSAFAPTGSIAAPLSPTNSVSHPQPSAQTLRNYLALT